MKTGCLSWACTAALELSQPQWLFLHSCPWLGGNLCPNSRIFVWTGIFQMSCSLNAVWSWRFAQFPLECHCKYCQDVCMCPAASSPPFPMLPKEWRKEEKIFSREKSEIIFMMNAHLCKGRYNILMKGQILHSQWLLCCVYGCLDCWWLPLIPYKISQKCKIRNTCMNNFLTTNSRICLFIEGCANENLYKVVFVWRTGVCRGGWESALEWRVGPPSL